MGSMIGIKKTEIILIFILFILAFPFIITVLGFTMYPVISNSMLHWYSANAESLETRFYSFWEGQGYSKEEVKSFPASDGFKMGDLLIASKSENFSIGDVVVWKAGNRLITHRVVEENETNIIVIQDQMIATSTDEELLKVVDKNNVEEKVTLVIPNGGGFQIFLTCMQNINCGFWCFFDPPCLQQSFFTS